MPDRPIGLLFIPERVNPGGVVLYIYATPSGRRLDTVRGDTIPTAALAAGARFETHVRLLPPDYGLEIVAYSGDTGRRLAPDGQPRCPHCGSADVDRGGGGIPDMCRTCNGMSRNGVPLVAHTPVDLGDDPDGDIEGYDGGFTPVIEP